MEEVETASRTLARRNARRRIGPMDLPAMIALVLTAAPVSLIRVDEPEREA